MTDQVIPLLQQLIRNGCVNDGTPGSGHEHRSVATLQEFFGVEGVVFEPAPGRQTLIYRVNGTDPTAPDLALVPHTDVVPVDPGGWSVDPFGAEVIDGFVYGRGAVDMLNVTAAMAVAARPYIRGERSHRGDLVFVAAADEEAGGVLGAGALVEERWDLVRAGYCLTEVAYPALEYASVRSVPVAVGEKGAAWTRLHTRGTPGHGSAPFRADNALEKMVAALQGIFDTPMPVDTIPEWVDFVAHLDLEPEVRDALTSPDLVDAALDRLAVTDPLFARYAHALTHLTVSPNMLDAGMKGNVIPDSATANVDIRQLPGMDRGFIDAHLRKAMGSEEAEIEPVLEMDATISATGNPLWEAIADSVEELEGHRNLIPTMMTVGTDGRFWRAKGSIGYGVGLFDDRMTFSEMLALFHGHDERVSVESVLRTTRLYQSVFERFLGS
jgi:acetylornithine deacetylase/succinyl-diaminopimelate desuccinylase-like protein